MEREINFPVRANSQNQRTDGAVQTCPRRPAFRHPTICPGTSPTAGLPIGELVFARQKHGKFWLFWINVPLGAAALVAVRGIVPPGKTTQNRSLERKGLLFICTGLPLLLYGATEVGAGAVGRIPVLAVAIGTVLVTGFFLTTRNATSPLIDLRLLRLNGFSVATITTGLTGANMYGGLLLLPLYLQLIGGRDPIETGLLLLVMGLGSAVALPVAGIFIDRYGPGRVCISGAVLLTLTSAAFLFPGIHSMNVIVPILILRGVGMAWGQMPAMTAAYISVSAEQMGDASTLVNIVQRIGGTIGAIGIVITLARCGGSSHPSANFGAFLLLVLVSAMALISAAILQGQIRLQISLPNQPEKSQK